MTTRLIVVTLIMLCIMCTASWAPEASGSDHPRSSNISRSVDSLYVSGQPAIYSNVYGGAVNPDTNRIYVATSTLIYVIDGFTGAKLTNVPLKFTPFGTTINAVTNKIYITALESGHIFVIDTSTNAIMNTILVPEIPNGEGGEH